MSIHTATTPLSQVRLRQLVQDLAAREHEWLSLVSCGLNRRWYQRLTCDDDHEVWLLSWLPGQRTGFHDHGESAGAFTVARGALRERTMPGRRAGPSVPVPQGEVRSFGPLVRPRCDQCLSAAGRQRARVLAAADEHAALRARPCGGWSGSARQRRNGGDGTRRATSCASS